MQSVVECADGVSGKKCKKYFVIIKLNYTFAMKSIMFRYFNKTILHWCQRGIEGLIQ